MALLAAAGSAEGHGLRLPSHRHAPHHRRHRHGVFQRLRGWVLQGDQGGAGDVERHGVGRVRHDRSWGGEVAMETLGAASF